MRYIVLLLALVCQHNYDKCLIDEGIDEADLVQYWQISSKCHEAFEKCDKETK